MSSGESGRFGPTLYFQTGYTGKMGLESVTNTGGLMVNEGRTTSGVEAFAFQRCWRAGKKPRDSFAIGSRGGGPPNGASPPINQGW